jgi:hypothetical protein
MRSPKKPQEASNISEKNPWIHFYITNIGFQCNFIKKIKDKIKDNETHVLVAIFET